MLNLDFPITAIAGRNGAGKSTILALACCAYHSDKNGFKLARRSNPYYTYSDFFVQHTGEASPKGIQLYYGYAHDNWRPTKEIPDGKGIGFQIRQKKVEGKWTNYDTRFKKSVVFLGIERIVPHSERSQSRSYSKRFVSVKPKGWEDKVRETVGQILGKSYDEFKLLEISKYSLPLVRVGDVIYSGFNMGAGENALFEIFSAIYSCGSGALIVMDEIELGLHAEAQRRFISKLKETCLETKTQVICTTHSKEIFDCLPDDARFFIEVVGGKTKITKGISSEFAFTKLGAKGGNELDIYVEDEVARVLLTAALPASTRARVSIKAIGSASAVVRQLAAHFIRKDPKPIIAVLDGDQRAKEADNMNHAKSMAENAPPHFKDWLASRLTYLPGDSWPETWLVEKAKSIVVPVSAALGGESDSLPDILEYGLQAGKHNEFHEIAERLGLEQKHCLALTASVVCSSFANEFETITTLINDQLQS